MDSDIQLYKVFPLRAYSGRFGATRAGTGDINEHWLGTPNIAGYYGVEWAFSERPTSSVLERISQVIAAERRRRGDDMAKLDESRALAVADEGQVVLPDGRVIDNASVVTARAMVEPITAQPSYVGVWQDQVAEWVLRLQSEMVQPFEDAANVNRSPEAARRHFERLGYIMLESQAADSALAAPAVAPRETV